MMKTNAMALCSQVDINLMETGLFYFKRVWQILRGCKHTQTISMSNDGRGVNKTIFSGFWDRGGCRPSMERRFDINFQVFKFDLNIFLV